MPKAAAGHGGGWAQGEFKSHCRLGPLLLSLPLAALLRASSAPWTLFLQDLRLPADGGAGPGAKGGEAGARGGWRRCAGAGLAGEGHGAWHRLECIPTLDPATGRPAVLVIESVVTALKQVRAARGARDQPAEPAAELTPRACM